MYIYIYIWTYISADLSERRACETTSPASHPFSHQAYISQLPQLISHPACQLQTSWLLACRPASSHTIYLKGPNSAARGCHRMPGCNRLPQDVRLSGLYTLSKLNKST